MTILDSSPSNNGRGSDAWSRPWTHLGIYRRSAGYCRVTFDHAPMNVTGATVSTLLHPPRMTLAQDLDRRRTPATGLRFHVVDGIPVRMIRGQTPVD